MKLQDIYQHPSFLNLENEGQYWHLIDPKLYIQRLNRILKRPEIRQAYHDAALQYDCVERWEFLEGSDYSRFPRWKVELRDGSDYLLPMDCERGDWRWQCYGRGRPPLFHDYVCMRACHWLCQPNLLVAQALFPDLHWVILTSEFHSSVACLDERLLFDLNYSPSALDVPAERAVEMLLKYEEGITIHDPEEGELFEVSERTVAATRLFELLDDAPVSEEEILQRFRHLLDKEEEETADESVAERELCSCC